jgi:hypothetical protein
LEEQVLRGNPSLSCGDLRQFDACVRLLHLETPEGGPPVGCLDAGSLSALAAQFQAHGGGDALSYYAIWRGGPGLPLGWQHHPIEVLAGREYFVFATRVGEAVQLARAIGRMRFTELTAGTVMGSTAGAAGLEAVRDVDVEQVLVPRSPTFWWAADNSWLVSTDIDADETLVWGSASLASAILDTPGLDSHLCGSTL